MGQSASSTNTHKVSRNDILQRIDKVFVNRSNNALSDYTDTLHWVEPTNGKVPLPKIGGNTNYSQKLPKLPTYDSLGSSTNNSTADNFASLASEFPELQQLREYLRNDLGQAGGCGCDGGDKKPENILEGGKRKKKSHRHKQHRSKKDDHDSSTSSFEDSTTDSSEESSTSDVESSSSSDFDEYGLTPAGNSEPHIVPFYSSENSINSMSDNYPHMQSRNNF